MGALSRRDYSSIRPELEERRWKPLLHSKFLTAGYYRSVGVPIPKTFGLLHPEDGFTFDGLPLHTADQLAAWCGERRQPSFVAKPIGGSLGRSVVVVDGIGAGEFQLADGSRMPFAQLDGLAQVREGGLSGHIVQERLRPHPKLAELAGGARTSFRVNTLATPQGDPEVQFVVVRLGRTHRMADNIENGAIYAPVDVETGTIGEGLVRSGQEDLWTATHPDTGLKFAGTVVPGFDEIRECAQHAARVTPGLRAVGWDIVLSDEGARMIEGNLGWNIELLQRVTGGWHDNGVVDAWRRHWGVDVPDGSLRWRLRRSRAVRLGRLVVRGSRAALRELR